MKKFSLLFTLLLTTLFYLHAQTDIFALNQKLGRGVNMGNMFEAPNEGEWGNPFKDEYFKKIKELGFNHVRIPIKWETPARTQTTPPYTINADFKNRIKYVIDLAKKEGLMVIINMHHHDELIADPTGNNRARFLAQWTQIADFFKDYDNDLLFEVLNEPNGPVTPQIWNTMFDEVLAIIRVKNPNRAVLKGTALYGGLAGLSALSVPADGKVIVSVHYYNPFPFTHQGAGWVNGADEWLGTTWNDTEIERDAMTKEFAVLTKFGNDNNVPVHVGEFGAFSTADAASRERWTTFVARHLESIKVPWTYWEWSAGFGVFDPSTNSVIPEIADALLKNTLGPPTSTILTPVYCSEFNTSLGGWIVNNFNGAQSTSNIDGGVFNINITQKGQESWHVQAIRPNIKLENGKVYRLSLIGKGNGASFDFYAGRNSDPWNAYSGIGLANLSDEFTEHSTVFKMTSPTDLAARIALDMGFNTGKIQIKSVKLEEVSFIFSNTDEEETSGIIISPNPSSDALNVAGVSSGDQLRIFDTFGKEVMNFNLTKDTSTIQINHLKSGNYLLVISKDKKLVTKKFIKI
jgi:aryl-phospho-beta-D-glucosidase BglC (GH1 family)